MQNLPKVIAHRGASRIAPENTLASLRAAKALGATWIECDVMLTADNQAIIFHDKTLHRTTNGKGIVANTSYAEIVKLDAGSWFDKKFINERVPTLSAYLQCAVELELGINIELKAASGKEDILAQEVDRQLKRYWPAHFPAPLISSFSLANLKAMRHCDQAHQLGLVLKRFSFAWKRKARKIKAYSLHFSQKAISKKIIDRALAENLKVLCYTVNEAQQAQQLLQWGVSGVFSDIANLEA